MLDHTQPMREIARCVRNARLTLGWSQQDLAEEAGVSRPSVARIEAAEDIRIATLAKVTGVLGLDIGITDRSPSGIVDT